MRIILEKGRIIYATDDFLDFFELKLEEIILKDFKAFGFKVFDKREDGRAFLSLRNKHHWVQIKGE